MVLDIAEARLLKRCRYCRWADDVQSRVGVPVLKELERPCESLAALAREVDAYINDLFAGVVFGNQGGISVFTPTPMLTTRRGSTPKSSMNDRRQYSAMTKIFDMS